MRERAPVALLIAGVTLLCGCGGSSSSSASAQMARYVAAGNAICVKELTELSKAPEPTTPAQAVEYLPRDIAIIRRESDRLAALEPPAAKRPELDAVVARGRRLGTLLDGFLHKLKTEAIELTTLAEVQSQSDTLRSQINHDFQQAGLSRCAT